MTFFLRYANTNINEYVENNYYIMTPLGAVTVLKEMQNANSTTLGRRVWRQTVIYYKSP